jgi:peptide subunit release factor 1 (eRF1)
VDPSVDLSWAKENLHAATDLMDQALAGMRRIHKALELQALELLIVARNHQLPRRQSLGSTSSIAGSISGQLRGPIKHAT